MEAKYDLKADDLMLRVRTELVQMINRGEY
jgi:hypothetical protein